ncbi:MAG: hydrogenase maturation nickel metallochaperone HypA [Oscillochloris sp.]|nr:hydrogenase maturation nickel metallochaperone HypA [Oscillochloris sp.]
MHELSIAYQLVEAASNAARQNGAARVTVVHLQLGSFAGVVRDALEFSFGIAAEDTPVAGAQLLIEDVPLTIFCEPCAAEAILPDNRMFRCPRCNTPSSRIVRGRELLLTAIEIEEPHGTPPG